MKTKFRVNLYSGYWTIQYRFWWCPFWIRIKCYFGSYEQAIKYRELIRKDWEE